VFVTFDKVQKFANNDDFWWKRPKKRNVSMDFLKIQGEQSVFELLRIPSRCNYVTRGFVSQYFFYLNRYISNLHISVSSCLSFNFDCN
jgi:hypothetical protein